MTSTNAEFIWHKSSFSSTGDNCVEIAHLHQGVAIRESDAPDTVIRTSRVRLAALLGGSKAGRFDQLIG